jgi:acetyl esterase
MHRDARVHAGKSAPVKSVRNLFVDGGDGPRPARLYSAEGEGRLPLLVFFHGGGFVAGDLDTHDAICRLLCHHASVHVLAVDYRLSPEHPFPAPINDALAALRWAFSHAAELGSDPSRIAVGGDSAGGNLSAVVAQLAARDGGSTPAAQLLIYPAVDRTTPYASLEAYQEGFLLTRGEIDWFEEQYLGSVAADRADFRVSPLRGNLVGLPSAIVVTAAFDPLRDEAEAYARALEAAGNRVILRRLPGQVHGCFSLAGVSPASRQAIIETAGILRAVLTSQQLTTSSKRARSAPRASA